MQPAEAHVHGPAAPQRRWASLVVGSALILTACASTQQEARPNGDLILHSGPTPLGWIAVGIQILFAVVFLSVFLFVATVLPVTASSDSVRDGRYARGVAFVLVIPAALALVGGLGWLFAANTVLKFQTSEVISSPNLQELRVERERLVGGDAVLVWPFNQIEAVEFDYIPGQGGDSPTPPQGNVYVRPKRGESVIIFEGAACPARDLAESLKETSGLSLTVSAGGRDISSVGSFLTQIRCGIESPFEASNPRQYPAEVWRVLDMPFLWRWPWGVPILAAQTGLIVLALMIFQRWRDSQFRTDLMIISCSAAALCVASMNVFAATSYGNWPGALALFALLAGRTVAKRVLRQSRLDERWNRSA